MRASVFLLLWTIAAATLLEKHSFVSPFNTVNAAGEREVDNWLAGGDTSVLQNFVRLTPDRQSKRGYLWNKASDGLATDSFSMLFKFRISGQGKTLFGDGLGLWFTEHGHFRPGQFHGFTEQFTGIGIVFDTFKNVEAGANHKDIMIVVNDGTKNADALVNNAVGCDANIRFHEGRADFSVANSSVARITYDGRSLRIEIDSRNSGTFVDCVTIDELGLSSGWVRRSTLGVTATTGALADNHDVLSLRIYDRVDEANLQYQSPAPQPSDQEHLIHHWEHQLTAIHDSLSINIKKLRKQEEEAEGRIKLLEESIGNQVQTTLANRVQELEGLNLQKLKEAEAEAEARIARLEQSLNSQFHTHLEERLTKLEAAMNSQLHRTMEHRISTLENVVETKIDQRLARLEKAMSDMITTTVAEGVETSRRSWLIPFVVLVVACVGVFLFVWRKYVWLRKQHLI